jgi:hypothetical protein
MRRTLIALAVAAVSASFVPTSAQASHACAEGFEILCTRICIEKPIPACTH